MTELRGPIDGANQQQAEREQQPVRHTVDTITSDALDQLYARLELLTARLEPLPDSEYLDQLLNGGPGRTVQLLGQGLWKERDRALAAEQRAEQAEAAIRRVRAVAEELIKHGCPWSGDTPGAGRAIRAALDEPKESRPRAAPTRSSTSTADSSTSARPFAIRTANPSALAPSAQCA